MDEKSISISVKFPKDTVKILRNEVARRMVTTGEHWTVVHVIREAVARALAEISKQ